MSAANGDMKRCGRCRAMLPLSAFARCAARKDGLQGRCRECNRRYYYEHSRDTVIERQRLWRVAHTEEIRVYRQANREREREYSRKSHVKYRDRRLAKIRQYRAEHRAKVDAGIHQWRRAHPLVVRGYHRKRRAIKRNVLCVPFTYAQVSERDGAVCRICSRPIEGKIHFDHWIPLDSGGPHCLENIRVTCARCNQAKGRKTPSITELPDHLIGLWHISRALCGMGRLPNREVR